MVWRSSRREPADVRRIRVLGGDGDHPQTVWSLVRKDGEAVGAPSRQ